MAKGRRGGLGERGASRVAVGAVIGLLSGVLAFAGACRQYDLPPLVATSAHFRYHARDEQQVPAGILDWLEAHRADVLTYLGVLQTQEHRVIDYYLYRDDADRDQNSPCLGGDACEQHGQIYTTIPAFEFELLHAYFSGLGDPPRLFQEGVGAIISWRRSAIVSPVAPSDWTVAATDSGHNGSGDIQSGGFLLSLYLLRTYGVARFVDYYGSVDRTEDPALIDLQFRRFWGKSVSEVWAVMTGTPDLLPRPSLAPICPCTVSALPNDGQTIDVPYPGQVAYFPLDPPAGGALALTLQSTSIDAYVQDCAREGPAQRFAASASGGRSLAIVRVPDGPRRYVGFDVTHRGQQIASVAGAWVNATCAGAQAAAVTADVDKITAIVPRLGGQAVWYLHLSLEGTRIVTLSSPADSSHPVVAVSSDCAMGAWSALGASPVELSGDVILQLTTGLAASLDVQRIELSLQ